jgi:hypothetical protein
MDSTRGLSPCERLSYAAQTFGSPLRKTLCSMTPCARSCGGSRGRVCAARAVSRALRAVRGAARRRAVTTPRSSERTTTRAERSCGPGGSAERPGRALSPGARAGTCGSCGSRAVPRVSALTASLTDALERVGRSPLARNRVEETGTAPVAWPSARAECDAVRVVIESPFLVRLEGDDGLAKSAARRRARGGVRGRAHGEAPPARPP